MNNKELIEKIINTAKEKGVDVPETEGKTDKDLAAILKLLNTPAPPPADDDDDDEEKKPPYYVANGKSITTMKGLLSEGNEVKAEFFPGGKDRLKELVKDKVVTKS